MRQARHAFALVLCLVSVGLSGCVLGPTALRASRTAYNKGIQDTTNEQLLLNLVRLQYREAPLFLEVGSIATQFTFEQSGSLTGTLNENIPWEPINPDVLRIHGQIGGKEQPTITYTPLQGEDFANRLLSPVRLDTVLLLMRSGWRMDRVLLMSVHRMNGVDNASNASSPTPEVAPRYAEFARVVAAFRALQTQGLLEFGYEDRTEDRSPTIPIDVIGPADVIRAAKAGCRFRAADDGKGYVLTSSSRALVWRIPPQAADAPEVREIIELLGLRPGESRYELGEMAGDFLPSEPAGQRTRIEIATRSLLGTLFYLSQAIEVPEPHRRRGVVTTTLTADGQPFDWAQVTGDLLRVHSQSLPPGRAVVAVRHRGYWFYIDDTDLTSKSTFALLGQLFALQAGREAGGAPVLTLPVGG